MKKAILIVVGAAILAAAWFLGSPLFIDRTVDEPFDYEPFDYTGTDGRVDIDAVLAMPEDMQDEMRDEIMATAAAAPASEVSESMPDDAPTVIARGEFRDVDPVHRGSGTATLYAIPGGRHLLRFEDFRTTNGPDLVVYLAKHPSPASADDVIDGGYLSLGPLKGNVGNQNYTLPAEIAVDGYNSVVIWCELFGVLFSPAPFLSADPESGAEPT